MFGIYKTYRNVKKGIKDPALLGQDLALDIVKDPLLIFTIIGIIFFAGLFILAFTGLLGGPFLGFKILFWVLFLPALLAFSVAWMFLGKITKMLDKAREDLKKPNIMDAEIIKGDNYLTKSGENVDYKN